MQRERGLVLITGYKLVKGGLWLVLALVLVVLERMGLEARLLGFADALRHHAHAWSLEFAKLVLRAASPRGVRTIMVALVADGTVSLLEGWALLHGHWWGPWLVVVATGSLLPFEVVAFVEHPHAIRAALFAANVAIVIYLARTAMRERREKRSKQASLP